jgi:selenocysteine lyase/cysteine desulfurase
VGHFYAYRLVKALHIDTEDGLLRASFVHYTSVDEINRLVAALRTIV